MSNPPDPLHEQSGPTCYHCKKRWPCGCPAGERILATLIEKYPPRSPSSSTAPVAERVCGVCPHSVHLNACPVLYLNGMIDGWTCGCLARGPQLTAPTPEPCGLCGGSKIVTAYGPDFKTPTSTRPCPACTGRQPPTENKGAMKRYVVECEFNVTAETPAAAVKQVVGHMPDVMAFSGMLVKVPGFGAELPTGAITGAREWMCVVKVKEHD